MLKVTHAVSERAIKSKVCRIKIVPLISAKNLTHLLPLTLLLVLHTGNNTDGNKLVIFSGIAWFCGDVVILC